MTPDVRPTIGVLALQGAFEAHEKMLASLGALTQRVRSREDLIGIDGIVLPGGESTTMSKLLIAFDLYEPLRAAISDGLAVLGTCAGMILLADEIVDGRHDQVCLGAMSIRVRRNAYGRQVDSFETEISIDDMDRVIPAVFIRAPAIEAVADVVRVLARVDGNPCLVSQGRALAASFHPELTDDTTIHELFLRIVGGSSGPGESNANTGVLSATHIQE